jgi:hypothetical protein
LRYQRSVENDAVTRVNRFLPVQGKPVGIFGHRDLGEKRFGRKSALDQMGGRRSLNHAVAVARGPKPIFRQVIQVSLPSLAWRHSS